MTSSRKSFVCVFKADKTPHWGGKGESILMIQFAADEFEMKTQTKFDRMAKTAMATFVTQTTYQSVQTHERRLTS